MNIKAPRMLTKDHSDYDWWYDHCTGYTNPLTKTGHIGYIGCGVSKYRCAERSNPTASPLTYNETNPTEFGVYANGCTIAQAGLFSGKLISKQTSTKNSDIILFDTENIANGVYLINISNRNISISNTKIINIK